MSRLRHAATALGLLAPACAPATAPRGRAAPTTAAPAPQPGTADSRPDDVEPAPTSSVPAPTTTTIEEPPTTVVTVTIPTTPRRTTTTFVLPERADEDVDDATWWRTQPGYAATGREALLACIRAYEQGANGYATDTGNGFFGAYQFDLATWRSVGGSGNPAHASPAEQDARAWALYQDRGLTPWPTPSRRCG